MNLIAFSFWNFILLAIGFFVLVGSLRLVGFLSDVSVSFIQTLTYAGLSQLARFILFVTVNYDRSTYCKNRLIYWNQVGTRFRLLWGTVVSVLYVLALLRVGNKVDSMIEPVALLLSAYLGYRTVVYFLVQHVKEHPRQPHQYPMPIIRPWDYLDELFAESSVAQPA